MKLTRAQQVYLGVLGLGLVALLLDKTVLAPARVGGAAPPPPPVAIDTAQDPVKAGAGGADTRAVAVADRLRAVASRRAVDPAVVADAFHPSEPWLGINAAGPAESTQDKAVREFQATYRLVGLMAVDGRDQAIVEDQMAKARGEKSTFVVYVGDSLGLFRLVSIDDHEAVFSMGDLVVVLRIRTGLGDDGVRMRGGGPADPDLGSGRTDPQSGGG